jgi:uncharacterized tellurite resistance protein B-like protein
MCRDVIQRVVRICEGGPPAGTDPERARVAAAALLVECARMDHEVSDAERSEIVAGVGRLFALEAEVAGMLVAVAEGRADDVWHDWLFTDAVRRGFDDDGRLALVRELRRVAVSNGRADPREEAFIRRIARELGVPAARVEDARRNDSP